MASANYLIGIPVWIHHQEAIASDVLVTIFVPKQETSFHSSRWMKLSSFVLGVKGAIVW
jgi:hypothetical protein